MHGWDRDGRDWLSFWALPLWQVPLLLYSSRALVPLMERSFRAPRGKRVLFDGVFWAGCTTQACASLLCWTRGLGLILVGNTMCNGNDTPFTVLFTS